MKSMRLAACVAVFALVGGIAFSQDMDIRALQAKLAAQEARLNDLQSKMSYAGNVGGGTADNVVSLRKNGKVTIGGDINTRYYFYDGEVKSRIPGGGSGVPGVDGRPTTTAGLNPGGRTTVNEVKAGTMRVSDAKLRVKVDVNDYFEAFIRVDLQDSDASRAFTAQEAYVRWKNVCNGGFSLLVGRTGLVFGGGNEAGSVLTGFYGGDGEGQIGYLDNRIYNGSALVGNDWTPRDMGDGMFGVGNGMMPSIIGYDLSRTTQLTGSWGTQDGRFLAELSLIQGIDSMRYENRANRHRDWNADYRRTKSMNYGLGSGSTRLTWKPIEGLKLVGSVVSLYQNADYTVNDATYGVGTYIPAMYSNQGRNSMFVPGVDRANSRSTAANLHVAWNPCFLPAFKIWAAYTYNWNAGWVDDLDAQMLHAGVSYNFTDKLSAYGIAEFMRHKNGRAIADSLWYKSNAWASYIGMKYNVGYGVDLEAGWRHEEIKFKGRNSGTHTKADMDVIYAHLGFSF